MIYGMLWSHLMVSQVVVDSVEIKEQRILQIPSASDYRKCDTCMVSTLEFLDGITSLQLQNNTPGGLTTILHRGHAHRHVPILWNGVNIQNVINGVYDVSLLPKYLMGQMEFYSHLSQSPLGNNGISGALMMDNGSKISHITVGISTLQNYHLSTHFHKTHNKFQWNIGAESRYEKNIFNYNINQLRGQRPSTELKKVDWTGGMDYFINSKSTFSIQHWGQQSSRLIPTSITASTTRQLQEDKNYRSQLSYKYYGNKILWLATATSMQEYLNFYTTGVNSESVLNIFNGRLEFRAKDHDFSLYSNYRQDNASPNFYAENRRRQTTQIGGYKKIIWSKSISSYLGVRQDRVDNQWMPISFNYNTQYKKHELIFATNYNLPGLNDLYWPFGGNENLKTERSESIEYKYKTSIKKLDIHNTLFGQLTDNWIQWLPSSQGFWTANNQKKVFSRGGDIRFSYPLYLGKTQVKSGLSYALNRATIVEHESRNDLIGKQLIYVPQHKATIDCHIQYKKHQVEIDYAITGARYDLQDESARLNPFHIVHLRYQYRFKNARLATNITNLTNSKYYLVRFFPMPGLQSEFIYQYIF